MALPTQLEIADTFINNKGFVTIHALSNWYRYKDGYWQSYPDEFLKNEIVSLLSNLSDTNKAMNGKPHKFSDATVRGVANIVKYQLKIKDELLNNYPHLINMKNGVYDVRSQALAPHQPDWYITSQLPFDYNEDAKCPRWEEYINTTFVDKEGNYDHALASYVQQAMGYSLTYDVSKNVMFWCLGGGANGKSVLIHILDKLVGDAAVTLDIAGMDRNPYATARLMGKKIAYATEADSGAVVQLDGIIKAIVDGEKISVREIRERTKDLISTAKIWWSMNRFPHVRDTSNGFWRRVKIIPFNRQFSEDEAIPNLRKSLECELSGIFNWCMIGLESLDRQGFIKSRQVNEIVKLERENSNPVAQFIDECTIKGITDTELSSRLMNAYKNWCIDNGYRPKNRNNFKKEVENLKFYYKKMPSGINVQGLKLRPTSPFSTP